MEAENYCAAWLVNCDKNDLGVSREMSGHYRFYQNVFSLLVYCEFSAIKSNQTMEIIDDDLTESLFTGAPFCLPFHQDIHIRVSIWFMFSTRSLEFELNYCFSSCFSCTRVYKMALVISCKNS